MDVDSVFSNVVTYFLNAIHRNVRCSCSNYILWDISMSETYQLHVIYHFHIMIAIW